MKTRKLVLLAACGILLVICILQNVLTGGESVKTFTIKESPDEIVVTSPKENYSLVLKDGNWYVGEKLYPANESSAVSIVDALTSIKVLDKVGSANNDVALARYELNEGKAITVEVKKGGKTIRNVVIGKSSTASSQNYILLDGGKEVYLATGNLSSPVSKTVAELRSKSVYSIDKNDISAVLLQSADGKTDFAVSRSGQGDQVTWYINQPDVIVDATKAASWFSSLGAVATPVWHDNKDMQGEYLLHAEIKTSDKTVTMDIYQNTDENGENPVYFGLSNQTPYQFELANYTVQKFQKTMEDIIQ